MRSKAMIRLALLFALASATVASGPENRVASQRETPRETPSTQKAGAVGCGAPTDANVGVVDGTFAYSDTGNTCTGQSVVSEYNNYRDGGNCNTVEYPGPELTYQFTVELGNDITVTLDPEEPADLGLMVLSDCEDPQTCVDFWDTVGHGMPSEIALGPDGLTPGTYFVYVDSYYMTGEEKNCGDYRLDITGAMGSGTGGSGAVPNGSDVPGAPLTLDLVGTDVRLDWSASCAGVDNDYGVYEGTLGDFTSHLPVACTTGGMETTTFAPGSGNQYYLVVPSATTQEGSYGTRTGGMEREASLSACLSQNITACN